MKLLSNNIAPDEKHEIFYQSTNFSFVNNPIELSLVISVISKFNNDLMCYNYDLDVDDCFIGRKEFSKFMNNIVKLFYKKLSGDFSTEITNDDDEEHSSELFRFKKDFYKFMKKKYLFEGDMKEVDVEILKLQLHGG